MYMCVMCIILGMHARACCVHMCSLPYIAIVVIEYRTACSADREVPMQFNAHAAAAVVSIAPVHPAVLMGTCMAIACMGSKCLTVP